MHTIRKYKLLYEMLFNSKIRVFINRLIYTSIVSHIVFNSSVKKKTPYSL